MRPLSSTRAALVPALLSLLACSEDPFQRMRLQPKELPYSSSEVFEDGRAMRTPPAGTVSREQLAVLSVPGARGPDGQYQTRIPVPLTLSLLERGRHQFEIVCANCHGLLGDGVSLAAKNMSLRPPPSLLTLPKRPDGYFFEVITEGFGLMIPFGNRLSPQERWAVVAYVRALQRSQSGSLEDAPAEVRSRLTGGGR